MDSDCLFTSHTKKKAKSRFEILRHALKSRSIQQSFESGQCLGEWALQPGVIVLADRASV
ncbi:hypothetical protein K461DRAFT_274614 [Myriangium duriaei CBS 260.36]|uniref:Uncharacterized protein n=1 Tax=Myriangium duriaei CBS 260.36 TaxID=1168546 RepID=A0A9P4J7N1_9PEZI|nr:hypothetical protein K461DRAFT_274614 [Myriangium duriaei CBS 260.36]